MTDERDKSREQIRDDLAYVLADDRTTPRGMGLAKRLLDELDDGERDRKALAAYGLLHDGKAGQHWIYAAAGRLAAGDLEADVFADFGYTKGRGGRYARERSQLRAALS